MIWIRFIGIVYLSQLYTVFLDPFHIANHTVFAFLVTSIYLASSMGSKFLTKKITFFTGSEYFGNNFISLKY